MDQEISYAQFTQKRFSLDVDMPFTTAEGTAVILPMVILSGRELHEAKKSAEKLTISMYDGKMPKKDEASSYNELYEENLCWQLIFYSIRLPGKLNTKFFPTIEACLDMLTPDQAGILKDCYLQLQLQQPWLIHLSDEEKIQNMISELMKDGASFFTLSSLTSVSQNLLITSLVYRLKNAMMDSTSLTSQPNDTLI